MNLNIQRPTNTHTSFQCLFNERTLSPASVWKASTDIRKSIHLNRRLFVFCLLLLSIALSSKTQAGDVEEIVVYGQPVPTGFHHYTSAHMTSSEMRSLYLEQTAYRGGMTPLDQAKMQWAQRCGSMMGRLEEQRYSCVGQTHDYLSLMLGLCNARESGRSIDYGLDISVPFIGASFTWTAPAHGYDYCADQAKNTQEKMKLDCNNEFSRAKRSEKTCQGHYSWK